MATTVNITTTYAGQFADEIIMDALKEAVSLNGITLKDGIKKSWTITKLDASGLIANRTCDFTDVGTVTLTERTLTPKDLEINLKLCKDDFRATQFAEQMGAGRNAEKLADAIRVAILAKMGALTGEATEGDIWHGVTATAGQFGGFVPRMTADGGVVDVTGTTVTSANALAEIGKVYDAIPVQLLAKPDMNIYISPGVYKAYQQALSGFGAAGLGAAGYMDQGTVGLKPLNYNGVNLFPTLGLNTSFMVAAQQSNLWFGTDLLGDLSSGSIRMIDQSPIDGSNNVNFVQEWAADTNYGVGAECVLYTPA